MKAKQAKDITGIKDAPLDASDLRNMIDGHMPYFNKLWESAKENELYLQGINLTDKQKKAYHNKERGHYAQPIVSDKMIRIIETQRNSKTSVKAEIADSFSGGDKAFPDIAFRNEIKAEIYSMRFKKIEKQSNFEFEETQIFTSGIAAKYGAAEVMVEYDAEGNPKIVLKKRDYLDCIWDSNAKQYDKEDGKFAALRNKVYRIDIRRDYGKKIADAISLNHSQFGRPANQYWGVQDKRGKRDYDIIYIYRVWVKMLRQTFHLIFGTSDYVFFSRAEAEMKERELKMPYVLQNQTIPQSDIVEGNEEFVDYYETTFNEILYYEQTDLKFFPIEIYQSYFFEDKIWCLADLLKPNNKLIDKLIAQIDHAIGTDVKDGWELVTQWLADGTSIPEAIRKIKAGEVLPVIRPGALNPIKQRGFNQQWVEMIGLIKSFEDQYTGGDLYSGVQKGKGRESENAVAMKLKQQELIAMLPIGNLKYWKRNLFNKVIWFIKKYDTFHSIQKIHASELSQNMVKLLQDNQIYIPSETKEGRGFIEINNPENQLTLLQDAEVDVYVTEESLSGMQKIAQFNNMIAMEKAYPDLQLSQTWNAKKMELLDEVSYEDRMKVWTEVQQGQQARAQAQQQQQEKENNIEAAKVLTKLHK